MLGMPLRGLAADDLGGEGKYYHIVWHQDAGSYMTEMSDALQVQGRSNTAYQYWQLLPTGKANCYHIRNAVTGNYIEACRTAKDNSYNIGTTATPVEYYVCQESSQGGAYRLTSTNCNNYDNTSATPVGLNKNGANSYIITWDAGTGNNGSYWDITPTEFDFDYEALEAKRKHTAFAKSAQVYFMPCGTVKSTYCARTLKVSGSGAVKELNYPCTTWNGTVKKSGTANTTSWWTLYTTDKGLVATGREIEVTVTLGNIPVAGYLAQVCFDWDHDGEFEDVQTIDNITAKALTFKTTVPADAKMSESRMRFRLTDNGLTGPDEEITQGQILDCIINTVAWDGNLTEKDLTVEPNDPYRGEAEVKMGDDNANDGAEGKATVSATPYGNAKFLCWLEGRKVVSTTATYSFDWVRPTHLVAVFSINTKEPVPAGIHAATQDGEADTPYAAPLYFDLSGRQVSKPIVGETYIRKDSPRTGQILIY